MEPGFSSEKVTIVIFLITEQKKTSHRVHRDNFKFTLTEARGHRGREKEKKREERKVKKAGGNHSLLAAETVAVYYTFTSKKPQSFTEFCTEFHRGREKKREERKVKKAGGNHSLLLKR